MAADVLAGNFTSAVDHRHLRAVIRAALRANGFDARVSELAAADRRIRAAGLKLRDLLLESLPPFAARADIVRMTHEDSYLWNCLPRMLAFGHEQAVVFRRLMHPDQRSLRAAWLMPVATFSAGISLLDYLADTLGCAESVFEVLDETTVASIFSSGGDAETRLREGYEEATDVRLRLLFALVAMCGAGIRTLYRQNRDDQGWHDLRATFATLHAAQKAVTFHDASPDASPSGADAVITKSALPFVAAYQIVELSSPPAATKRAGRELARQIGQAIAVTDDLVDFLPDWQSGAPNTIIRKTRTDDSGSGASLTDIQLYRLIEDAASEIVSTLRAASLLYPARRPTATRPTAVEGAAKFATLTIARWVGWREELSQPSVFAFHRPRPARTFAGPCASAVNMLLEQQRTGYREAIHWMTVPRLDADHVRLEPARHRPGQPARWVRGGPGNPGQGAGARSTAAPEGETRRRPGRLELSMRCSRAAARRRRPGDGAAGALALWWPAPGCRLPPGARPGARHG